MKKKQTSPKPIKRKPLSITNPKVKKEIEEFRKEGKSSHLANSGTLQHVIDYCEQECIPYLILAQPYRGYLIEKLKDYSSTGDSDVTAAVDYALRATVNSRFYGGPHRWHNRLLRYVGKLMSDYAKEVKRREGQLTSLEEQSVGRSIRDDSKTGT